MHLAAYVANKQIAEFLVANGAQVNAKDNRGRTPLHMASGCGSPKLVEFLLGKGADVSATDENGETALDVAARKQNAEAADLLRSHKG